MRRKLLERGDVFVEQSCQSLEMMTTRDLVVSSRGVRLRSRLPASECQATVFSSSVWQRHLNVVAHDELVFVPIELGVRGDVKAPTDKHR